MLKKVTNEKKSLLGAITHLEVSPIPIAV